MPDVLATNSVYNTEGNSKHCPHTRKIIHLPYPFLIHQPAPQEREAAPFAPPVASVGIHRPTYRFDDHFPGESGLGFSFAACSGFFSGQVPNQQCRSFEVNTPQGRRLHRRIQDVGGASSGRLRDGSPPVSSRKKPWYRDVGQIWGKRGFGQMI